MGLCAIENPVTTPADTTIESTWPGYLRTFKQQVLDSFELEHTCGGKHPFGVDIGTANAYSINLDVSMGPLLAAGLYAGLVVRMQIAHTNTAASSFLLLVNGSPVGSSAGIKILGADPLAGQLLVGQVVTLVYDGTVFQCVSGYATTKFSLPTGARVQIATAATSYAPLADSVVPTNMATYSLLANKYTTLEIDVDIIATADQVAGRSIQISIVTDAGTYVQSFDVNGIVQQGFRMRTWVPGGQTSTKTYLIVGQLNHAAVSFSASVVGFSVVGIV